MSHLIFGIKRLVEICGENPDSFKLRQKYRAIYAKALVRVIVAGDINRCRSEVGLSGEDRRGGTRRYEMFVAQLEYNRERLVELPC